MKQDIDLMRKILLTIEEKHQGTPIPYLAIDEYEKNAVAFHCKLLFQNGLISSFAVQPADDDPYYWFSVGGLTTDGYKVLEQIRSEKDWGRIKKKMARKKLPAIIEVIKNLLLNTITAVAEGVTKGLKG